MTDLGFRVSIYLFVWLLSFLSLLFSPLSSLFIYYPLSVSHPLSIIHTCCSFDLITHILSLSLSLSLFINQSINQSSPLCHPLSLFTIFSERHFFTGHSHRSFTQDKSQRTSNRCNMFIPINTNLARPYTYHSFVYQWTILSILIFIINETRQDKTWHDMTRWLTLSKNDNKNTSGNDKVRIKSPYFHQKSYFIWQNNTKVLILQYMSNVCPIPNKHLCSLDHQWLVSRSEDEYDDQSSFKVKVYLPSLCSGCWGHHRCDDGFIFHRSEYITHNPYLRWLIRTYHSSHMTHHYSWLSQMTYHQ